MRELQSHFQRAIELRDFRKGLLGSLVDGHEKAGFVGDRWGLPAGFDFPMDRRPELPRA